MASSYLHNYCAILFMRPALSIAVLATGGLISACGSRADEDLASIDRTAPAPAARGYGQSNGTAETPETPLLPGNGARLPSTQKTEGGSWRFIIGQLPGQGTGGTPAGSAAPLPTGECQAEMSLGAQVDPRERNSISYALAGKLSAACAARPHLFLELNTPHPVRLGGALRCMLLRERPLPIQCSGAAPEFHAGNGIFHIALELDAAKDYRALRALLSLQETAP